MDKVKSPLINLQYTEQEWEIIDAIVRDAGCECLMDYCSKQLKLISQRLDMTKPCSEDVVVKRVRRMRTPPYVSKMLTHLKCKYGIEPGYLVSRLIIFPALKEYHDRNGY
jgi:hypothetical protein